MGLEHLRHALERQAEEAATAELEAARAEAARIEAEAAERLARRMSGDLEEHAVVLRAAAERAIAETRRTERRPDRMARRRRICSRPRCAGRWAISGMPQRWSTVPHQWSNHCALCWCNGTV